MAEQLELDFGDGPAFEHRMRPVQSDIAPAAPKYYPVEAGGVFEHRSGDCLKHGENVAFFKAYKAPGPYYCVQCALEVL